MLIELTRDDDVSLIDVDSVPTAMQRALIAALSPTLYFQGNSYALDYMTFSRLLKGEALSSHDHPIRLDADGDDDAAIDTRLCLAAEDIATGPHLRLPQGRIEAQPCRLYVPNDATQAPRQRLHEEGYDFRDGGISRYLCATLRYSLLDSTANHVAALLAETLPEAGIDVLVGQALANQFALPPSPTTADITQAVSVISRLMVDATEADRLAAYIESQAQSQRDHAEASREAAHGLLRQVQSHLPLLTDTEAPHVMT